MSGYLINLARRTLASGTVVRPRLPLPYEPTQPTGPLDDTVLEVGSASPPPPDGPHGDADAPDPAGLPMGEREAPPDRGWLDPAPRWLEHRARTAEPSAPASGHGGQRPARVESPVAARPVGVASTVSADEGEVSGGAAPSAVQPRGAPRAGTGVEDRPMPGPAPAGRRPSAGRLPASAPGGTSPWPLRPSTAPPAGPVGKPPAARPTEAPVAAPSPASHPAAAPSGRPAPPATPAAPVVAVPPAAAISGVAPPSAPGAALGPGTAPPLAAPAVVGDVAPVSPVPSPARWATAAEDATPGPAIIHVTIGRVEVRARPAAEPPNRPVPRPEPVTLEEYLRRRSRGGAG